MGILEAVRVRTEKANFCLLQIFLIFQWKIAILSHEDQEISHIFEPIQFFLCITGIFSRSPKTSQFAVGSGAILLKVYGSVKPALQSRIS